MEGEREEEERVRERECEMREGKWVEMEGSIKGGSILTTRGRGRERGRGRVKRKERCN